MSAEKSPLPELPCLCATTRRAARALTQFYDSHLRESGMEATQFALLMTLRESPARSQHDIAEMLAVDKTTLSRNLQLLERKGWIALAPSSEDRRRRAFVVTRQGMRQIKAAAPYWQRAQREMRTRLEERAWQGAWKTLAHLSRAAKI